MCVCVMSVYMLGNDLNTLQIEGDEETEWRSSIVVVCACYVCIYIYICVLGSTGTYVGLAANA